MPRAEAAPAGRPSGARWRRTFGRAALAAVLLGYAGLLFVRWYRPDPSDGMGAAETALAWLSLMGVTFLPHAGLALVVGLGAFAALRLWGAAAASLPLAALCVGPWVLGLAPLAGTSGTPRVAVAGESLLILSANLRGVTTSDVELLEQIEAHAPDVILLQEVTPGSRSRLEAAIAERYPHMAPAPGGDIFGEAVYSRLPFTREPRLIMPPNCEDLPQVLVWVEWQGRELCLADVHLHSPVSPAMVAAQARLAWELGPMLDAVRAEGTEAIVAGDFNSPWAGQPLDALRERGFAEAHREAGLGPARSWPARGPFALGPGIRIDHVAYTPGLDCVEAWGGAWTSSDHRPQFARFVWADRAERE